MMTLAISPGLGVVVDLDWCRSDRGVVHKRLLEADVAHPGIMHRPQHDLVAGARVLIQGGRLMDRCRPG